MMSSLDVLHFMWKHPQHCITTLTPPFVPSMETFPLFPLLPPELRLKIWSYAASVPRNVEVSCTPSTSTLQKGRWFSHSPAPAILFVNTEARQKGLRFYEELGFEGMGLGYLVKGVWINWEIDTLWLCGDLGFELARELIAKNDMVVQKVRFVAVKQYLWHKLIGEGVVDGGNGPAWRWGGAPKENYLCELKRLEDVRFHG